MRQDRRRTHGDSGSVLIIVLVVIFVLGLVVVAIAKYATSTLVLGQTVEQSADRLSTANGAMDNALEDIQRNASSCVLFDQDYAVTDTINGITAQVDCSWQGGDVSLIDRFAVIITGDGAGRTGPMLRITNGGNSANAEKVFEGPVYMGQTPSASTLSFNATLTIKGGDLHYSNGTCPGNVQLPGQLTITNGYVTKCRTESWSTLFAGRRPPEPTVTNATAFPARSNTPPTPDSLGCYVWEPGMYTAAPNLANQSYNYFKSGDYYFQNVGTWSPSNAFVLMGYPGAGGPSIDSYKSNESFNDNPCRNAWQELSDGNASTYDGDRNGAAVYLGGNSTIMVDQNSTMEISGREHSGYNVGLQALETSGVASNVRGDSAILTTGSGSNKQLSIQGLVWAPYAAFEFDLVANDAVAALTGGAVVGELSAGASANANNFIIRVDTQPSTSVLHLTTTATNSGSTSVKAVVDVRTTGSVTNYGVRSRRILDLTPE
jgi:hypothetical protein